MNKCVISSYQWKLSLGVLYLFALTLPFSLKFSNILLVIVAALLIIRKDYLLDLKKSICHSTLLSLIALFGIYAISILWSDNKAHGGFILEKHLSLLIIPLAIIPAISYLRPHIRHILSCFVFGMLLAFGWLFYQYFTNYQLTIDIGHFFREVAVHHVQLHPSYLAMYTGFAFAVVAVKLIFTSGTRFGKVLLFILLLTLFTFILMTGARMPLLALLVITFVLASDALLELRYGWLLSSGLLILMVLVGYYSLQTPLLKSRVTELSHTAFKPPKDIYFNSVNLRVAQFLCSKELISQHWLAGVGIGDVQDKLNNCYQQYDWSPALYERSYNSHNQYLQTWLSSGVAGLLILLFILSVPLWKGTNRLHLILTILFAICCLTESMLEKNKGIVFFVFFYSLLSYSLPASPKGKKEKTGN